jgi:uncharacterized protein Usg
LHSVRVAHRRSLGPAEWHPVDAVRPI